MEHVVIGSPVKKSSVLRVPVGVIPPDSSLFKQLNKGDPPKPATYPRILRLPHGAVLVKACPPLADSVGSSGSRRVLISQNVKPNSMSLAEKSQTSSSPPQSKSSEPFRGIQVAVQTMSILAQAGEGAEPIKFMAGNVKSNLIQVERPSAKAPENVKVKSETGSTPKPKSSESTEATSSTLAHKSQDSNNQSVFVGDVQTKRQVGVGHYRTILPKVQVSQNSPVLLRNTSLVNQASPNPAFPSKTLLLSKISTPSGSSILKRAVLVHKQRNQSVNVCSKLNLRENPLSNVNLTANNESDLNQPKTAKPQASLTVPSPSTGPDTCKTCPLVWSTEPHPVSKYREMTVLCSGGCKAADHSSEENESDSQDDPDDPKPPSKRRRKKGPPPESLPCPKQLDDMLPKSFKYHIASFQELGHPDKFKAEVRVNIFTKEEALKWLKEYEDVSGTNFRVTKTFKENSHRLIFKKCFKCHQHATNRYAVVRRNTEKHVGCEAKLSITVKNQMKLSTDLLLSEFPCVLGFKHDHCHPVNTPEARRFRRALPEVREKFATMFKARVTPSAALRLHKLDLQREYGDKYSEVVQDGAKCPTLYWCYHLYYHVLGQKVKEGRKKSTRVRKSTKGIKKRISIPGSIPMNQTNVSSKLVDIENISDNIENLNKGGSDKSLSGMPLNTEERQLYDNEQNICDSEEQRNAIHFLKYGIPSDSREIMTEEVGVLTERVAEEHGVHESIVEDVFVEDNVDVSSSVENTEVFYPCGSGSSMSMMNNNETQGLNESGAEMISSSEALGEDDCFDGFENPVDCGDQEASDDEILANTQQEGDAFISENMKSVKEGLQRVCDSIKSKVNRNSKSFIPAIESFVSSCDRLLKSSDDSELVTALANFGRDLPCLAKSRPIPNPKKSNFHNSPISDKSILNLLGNHLHSKLKPPSTALVSSHASSAVPKRKVLVLRMDRKGFQEVLERANQSEMQPLNIPKA